MPIDKDGFNNLAWELRFLEENQDTLEAELIIASRRQLEGVLANGAIEFDQSAFDDLEQLGDRELVKQLSPTQAVYKRPEKRWTGGGWDIYEAQYWRLEMVDSEEPHETAKPKFYVTVMPGNQDGVFEEGVMPKVHAVDVGFGGYSYPVGGHLDEGVYSEPGVQAGLDEMIDALTE